MNASENGVFTTLQHNITFHSAAFPQVVTMSERFDVRRDHCQLTLDDGSVAVLGASPR
jgi:hypothetical protein